MGQAIIKREVRADVLGTYYAFIYDDGHTETYPANRPVSREDYQRMIRNEEALKRASDAMAAEKTRYLRAGAGASNEQIRRAEFDSLGGRIVTQQYGDAIQKRSVLADTATASKSYVDDLLSTVDLGGPVVGANAGKKREYYTADSKVSLQPIAYTGGVRALPNTNMVREVSDG